MKKLAKIALVGILSCFVALPVLADLNDGLVAYYPFNGNANDESGNGLDGTVNGATLTEDRFGNADSAYNFDGDDSIKVPNFTLNPDEDFTFSLWIVPNHHFPSQGYSILFNREGAYELAIFIGCSLRQCDNDEVIHSNELGFAVRQDWDFYSMNYVTNKNEVHFVTIVYDSSNNRVLSYVNGILTSSDNIGNDSITSINDFLCIGARGNCDRVFFTGVLDDIRIYNRILFEEEIKSLYMCEDECEPPLLAELANFTATPIQNTIRLDWETTSELNTAGFFVWRGTPLAKEKCTNDSSYKDIVQIGFDSARGGLLSGATYSLTDSNVTSGTTYCYLLEEIEFDRDSELHWDFIDSATAK